MFEIPIVHTASVSHQPAAFAGYGDSHFIMLPQVFVRHQMQDLSESELKVMLYIFDHTWGYLDRAGQRKNADAISRSQFLNGIRRADGSLVDRGAGVSERSLDRALASLVARAYIFRHRRLDPAGRWDTTVYELNRTGKPQWGEGREESGERRAESRKSVDTAHNGPVAGPIPHSSFLIPHSSPPANLPPPLPANLRPPTGAKVRDTIENAPEKTLQKNPQTPPELQTPEGCVSGPDKKGGVQANGLIRNPRVGIDRGACFPDDNKARPASITNVVMPDPQADRLAEELLAARISKAEADRLARTALANGHRPGYIGQALEYIGQQREVKNREGLLIHLVRTNWQPARQADPPQPAAPPGFRLTAPLPTAQTVNPRLLPRLIEIELRNLTEARSDHDRYTAQARLERYRQLESQFAERSVLV